MERQKARWRKSEDGPDVEKIVTFYVASGLHGQFFLCGNFYLPHKNYHVSFSANAVVT